MKKLVPVLAASLMLAAPLAYASEDLAKEYKCTTCHTANKKKKGPSYKEIAAKYKGKKDAVSHLSKSIMEGSKDVWGKTPMKPQKKVTPENAEALAKWIMEP